MREGILSPELIERGEAAIRSTSSMLPDVARSLSSRAAYLKFSDNSLIQSLQQHPANLLGALWPVIARYPFELIGKETDRRWEQGEDISLLQSKVTAYRPNETARLTSDHELAIKCQQVSIRELAKAAGVSESTVKAARCGKRLRKTVVQKLRIALNSMNRAA